MGGATQPTHNHRQAGEKERWQMRFAQTAEDHCQWHSDWHWQNSSFSFFQKVRGTGTAQPVARAFATCVATP